MAYFCHHLAEKNSCSIHGFLGLHIGCHENDTLAFIELFGLLLNFQLYLAYYVIGKLQRKEGPLGILFLQVEVEDVC